MKDEVFECCSDPDKILSRQNSQVLDYVLEKQGNEGKYCFSNSIQYPPYHYAHHLHHTCYKVLVSSLLSSAWTESGAPLSRDFERRYINSDWLSFADLYLHFLCCDHHDDKNFSAMKHFYHTVAFLANQVRIIHFLPCFALHYTTLPCFILLYFTFSFDLDLCFYLWVGWI